LFFTLHKILTLSGIIPLLKAVSRLFARLTGTAVTARAGISDVREQHIRTILEETRDEAVLSPVQSEIISRVVSIPQIRLRSVMTGLGKVRMVHRKADRASLLDLLSKSAFTRFPVYDHSPTDIVGYIDIYQALNASKEFTDLQEHIRPICTLAEDMAVVDAIRVMQKENHKIVLVAGPGTLSGQRNVGIVTMKDLVEELLGELTEW
jgi:CBS domain containing-hemolysin-like protein